MTHKDHMTVYASQRYLLDFLNLLVKASYHVIGRVWYLLNHHETHKRVDLRVRRGRDF